MKKTLVLLLTLALTAACLFSCDPDLGSDGEISNEESKVENQLVIPQFVDDPIISDEYEVLVGFGELQSVPCYRATVGKKTVTVEGEGKIETDEMAFCYFDCNFSSPLTVTVKPKKAFTDCVVRPLAEGITVEKTDGGVTFTLTEPTKLSVEFDGEIYTNLFIYANAPETEIITSSDRNVRYFGAGVYDAGEIVLRSNQTLYLAPGAVVYGTVTAEDAENVSIKGRGILCGGKLDHKMNAARYRLATAKRCDNLTVDGVIFIDSPTWTFMLEDCNGVRINNLKQICWFFNSDGIDVCSCTDVNVTDCMLRNYDDNISVKCANSHDSTDMVFSDCIFWADCAHNMLVGPEALAAEYENKYDNITFENITVLEQKQDGEFYKGVMALTCADNARFSNITWKDIVIERMSDGAVINFRFSDDYGTYYGKSINGITVKNVRCDASPANGDIILGLSDTRIGSVTIENYTIKGAKVAHGSASFKDVSFVDSLVIDGDEKKYADSGSELYVPYLKFVSDDNGTATLLKTFESGFFTPGTTYTVKAVARFTDIDATKGSNPGLGLGYVNFYIYDKADASKLLSFNDFARCTGGSEEWKTHSYNFKADENTGMITCGIGFWEATGTIEVSEITITSSDGTVVFTESFDTLDTSVWEVKSAGKSAGIVAE